jgi:O-antigen/teichoic acid export membrane protein
MTGAIRRLSRDFAVYGVGEVVVKAFSLVSIPIYTRAFSPAEFGLLSYVTTLVGLMSAVLILGGDSAYARFFFEARTPEQKRIITSTWIGFLAAWSALACLALLPFAEPISVLSFGDTSATDLLVLGALAAPVALINRMCAQVLRNEFRPTAYTVLNVSATALLIVFSVFAAVGLRMGLVGVLAGAFVAELVMLPLRLWSARSMLRLSFSVSMLRQLLAYGIPLVPTSLAYWVFLTSDRLLLAQLSTLEQLGIYSVASSLVGIAMIAISAFGQAWSPHAVQLYEDERDAAPAIYGRIMTYVLAGFGFLAVAITTFRSEILAVLASPHYADAAAAIAPLAIGMVAMASTHITAAGISLTKRTAYFALLAWVAAIVNVMLNLLLDEGLGMLGAAWATALAYVTLTLLYLSLSQRLWAIAYEVRRSLTLIALILVFVFSASLWEVENGVAAIVVKVAFCSGFLMAAVFLRAIDDRELANARHLLARLGRGDV